MNLSISRCTSKLLKKSPIPFFCVFTLVFICSDIMAKDQSDFSTADMMNMDLHQLLDIEVTLASRTKERQLYIPAAIYILTQEDIRRSGLRRIPELLRMVPGLHIAKIDANKWSVSSRNNQSRFSSTMQVMIDGKNVFTPFFGGVYWENLDTFIEDIERIEIIRGPGGSLWGTNAVDGIVNIITFSAADTHGLKEVVIFGANNPLTDVGIRYGGVTKNNVNYRIFAKRYTSEVGVYLPNDVSTNNGFAPIGSDTNDSGLTRNLGMRMDWSSANDTFMLQSNYFNAEFNEDRVVSGGSKKIANFITSRNLSHIFNWKRQLSDTKSFSFNSFYDDTDRDDGILQNDETTVDLDFQYNWKINNQIFAGGLAYRNYDNYAPITDPSTCASAPCFGVNPASKVLETWSFFVHYRYDFSEFYSIEIGTKLVENDFTGFEHQPTLRSNWTPSSDISYWAAYTRAVRLPDRILADGELDFGSFKIPVGDKDREAVVIHSYEVGYRQRISNLWVLDSALYYNKYKKSLQKSSTTGRDNIYGFEGYAKYQFSQKLRLELGYTFNAGRVNLVDGTDRPLFRFPKNTLNLRSYYALANNVDIDFFAYYVHESKHKSDKKTIPAYTKVDVRLAWRPINYLSVSMLLTNLLDESHADGYDSFKINSGSQRGVFINVTYTTPH